MNGLAITIIVGPAAEAVRLLHRRRLLPRRRSGRSSKASTRRDTTTLLVGLARARRCCCVLPRITRRVPAVLVAVVGATARLGRCSSSPATASARSARCRRGFPRPSLPVDERERRRAAADRRDRDHARLADGHDRDGHELRGPARRRGRAQPGDDRHGRRQHRRRASSRASPSPRAARAPPWPSSPAPRARSPASSAPGSSWCCCCSSTRCSPTCPQTALAAVVIVAALSLMDLGDPAPLPGGAPQRASAVSLVASAGRDPARRAAGDRGRGGARDPAVLPAQLVAARRGARARRRGRGLARRRRLPRRRAAPGRRRLPLGGAAVLRQRGLLPRSRSASSPASASRAGSCCSARRSPMST